MSALLGAVFLASLLGSLHCLGMCGGLVALWAGRAGCQGSLAGARAHLAYHLGRAASYALVGAVAGALGGLIDRAGGALLHVQRGAAMAAGLAVLLWGGAVVLGELRVLPAPHAAPLAGLLPRLAARAHKGLLALSPARQALLTGALTPLLPCGWLWLFALAAAGSGGAAPGAAVMLAFFAGTVPPLLLGGLGLAALAGRLRPRLRLLGGLGLVLVGGLSLLGRGEAIAALPRLHDPLAPIASATPAQAPCCCAGEAPAPEEGQP